MQLRNNIFAAAICLCPSWALTTMTSSPRMTSLELGVSGNLHGQNSCFMPLKQMDQDYYAPRIIQVR